jgi:tellurite resistance protein TehA-like permease
VRALTEWSGVRDLSPGYFALVMATGILSTAAEQDGAAMLSRALLVLTIVCYLVLLAATSWRLARYRAEFLADGTDPALAFTMFTFVAGSDVLGARLAAAGYGAVTQVLLVLAGAAGVVLYLIVATLVLARLLHFPVPPAGVRRPSRSYSSTPT